jgi:hypothetical protein
MGLLLVAYFVTVWRGFTKLSRDESLASTWRGFFAGARAGMLGFFVAGIAGSSFAPVPEQAFLWLAIGFMYGFLLPRRVDPLEPGR